MRPCSGQYAVLPKTQHASKPSALARALAAPLRALVWIYRRGVSPLIGAHCRYQPTCSAYAEEALSRYGAFRGGWLTVKRLTRCQPWGGSGYDPVPDIDSAGADEHDAR